jgi:hypothetical protein
VLTSAMINITSILDAIVHNQFALVTTLTFLLRIYVNILLVC